MITPDGELEKQIYSYRGYFCAIGRPLYAHDPGELHAHGSGEVGFRTPHGRRPRLPSLRQAPLFSSDKESPRVNDPGRASLGMSGHPLRRR